MKFRKKPVVVEAVQWNGMNRFAIQDFCGVLPKEMYPLLIHTLEGNMLAEVGDWIIKGVKGEFYPCKPEHFGLTYEKVHGDKPDKVSKCKYDKDGACEARCCYSNQKCGARDPMGNPIYKSICVQPDAGGLLTPEERNACIPTAEELELYLLTPDDEVCAKFRKELPSMTFRIIGECILYAENIAKAQLAKDQAHEQTEKLRIKKELEESCPHKTNPLEFRSKQFCEICWQSFWDKERVG